MVLFLLIQAAALPDIQLDLRADIERVRIVRRGETSLEMRASPDAGSDVRVTKPEARGRARLRDVHVRVEAEARIGAPEPDAPPETDRPQ